MMYYPHPVFVSKRLFKIIKKEGLLIRKTPDKKFWITKSEYYGIVKICVCETTSWRKMKRISRKTEISKIKEFDINMFDGSNKDEETKY